MARFYALRLFTFLSSKTMVTVPASGAYIAQCALCADMLNLRGWRRRRHRMSAGRAVRGTRGTGVPPAEHHGQTRPEQSERDGHDGTFPAAVISSFVIRNS
jgi:hypothetical protein